MDQEKLRKLLSGTQSNDGTGVLIFCGHSGVGKGALISWLRNSFPDLVHVNVSYTTRQQREGEIDGRDYHFVDEATFSDMVTDGAFVEHAQPHRHARYGTARHTLAEAITSGKLVVLEVNVDGVAHLRDQLPNACCIFVTCDFEEITRRLRERGADEDEITTRLATIEYEYLRALDLFQDDEYLPNMTSFQHGEVTLDGLHATQRLLLDRVELACARWFPRQNFGYLLDVNGQFVLRGASSINFHLLASLEVGGNAIRLHAL